MSDYEQQAQAECREDVAPEKLYGTSETYAMESLDLCLQQMTEEIGSGNWGNIYKGTITRSYGVQHKLYRGLYKWDGNDSPYNSFSYFAKVSQDGDILTGKQNSKTVEETVSVAVKTIRTSEDEVLDLTREASSLRTLDGIRNVASVYGVTYNRKMRSVCVVMELIQGPDLNSFLRSGKLASSCRWSWWKTKLEIFMELVIGLSACHKRGVYHGDLKGKNVLVDRFMVPKIIDFGFSFRKRDVEYLKSLGGSPFWISPELSDELDEIPPEVLQNPFPSDVYSLGMVLVEMCIDGEIPEYMDWSLRMNKYLGGSPVELQVPQGMEDMKEGVFDEIFAVVDGCCCADRDERISLDQCLVRVQAAYNNLCSAHLFDSDLERKFTSSKGYSDMLAVLQPQFPGVPDALLHQPAKNMMVDIQGTLLVDLFCRLDFEQGVEFIIENGICDFNPEVEVPRLCHICVKQGSPKVLKYLSQRWQTIILQEEWLMHEACQAHSLEVLRILLDDIGMDYDTWSRSGQLKPLHKLAFGGKVAMMRLLLDRAKKDDYVNTIVHVSAREWTPLHYAIEGDSPEAVFFLLENGGYLVRMHENGYFVRIPRKKDVKVDFLEDLSGHAMCEGSLRVATRLLEVNYRLKTEDGGSGTGIELPLPHRVLLSFERHNIGEEYKSYKYVLSLLQNHLVESRVRGMEPLRLACLEEGNKAVFRMMLSFCDSHRIYVTLKYKLCRLLGEHGSKEMVAYALHMLKGFQNNVLNSAIEHGNSELVDFLKAWNFKAEADDDKYSSDNADERSGQEYHKEEEFAPSQKQISSSGMKNKFKVQVLSVLEGKEYQSLESLEGIELVDEVERITKSASIWSTISPNLLRRCAYSGNLEMVEHLLEKNVPVDGTEYRKGAVTETPLMRAVTGQHFEVAEKILLAGADPNARMKAGYTCMDIALGVNNTKLIRLLIKFGFDTGSKNRDNVTYMDLITHLNN